MSAIGGRSISVVTYPEMQTPATIDLQPPVKDTVNNVINLTSGKNNVIICSVIQNNDEAAAKNVTVTFTIDGVVYTASLTLNSSTLYQVYILPDLSVGSSTSTVCTVGIYGSIKAKTVKVDVTLTSVAGTNQRLRTRVLYTVEKVYP